jgi:uncharacterized RDD family membrane protein YckC
MHPYGGFWIRVLAYIIDVMIVQFASSILIAVGMGVMFAAVGVDESFVVASVIALYTSLLVLNWLYFAIMESSRWQGTVGKQALKLIVTDQYGERIGFGRATGRYFAKILSGMIFLIGYFMVGWTERKQGLHDLVAGTLVQKADSPHLATNVSKAFE